MNKFYMLFRSGYFYKRGLIPQAVLTIFFLSASIIGVAQVALPNTTPVIIDFSNSMPATAGTSPATAFAADGFSPNPTSAGRLNSNAWASTGWSDLPAGLIFGGTQTGNDFGRGIASAAVNTGGIYAYTGTPHSAANPVFLMQPGGSDFTSGTLTLKMQNTNANLVNELAVSYNIYIRDDQARSNSLNFSYSSDGINFTAVPALDYTSPTGPGNINLVLAGARSTTITGLSIPQNAFFYIRWIGEDGTGSGSRDEFGLDDISLTAGFTAPCIGPGIPASLVDYVNTYSTQLDLELQRGNGTGGVLIVAMPAGASPTLPTSAAPTSGIIYAANSNYGTGAALGNGFVVYNSGAIPANTAGNFTITGLTAGTSYDLYYFEYNTTGPCYNSATSNMDNVSTAAAPVVSSPSNFFRAKSNGDWANVHTWQSSTDNLNWSTSLNPNDLVPTELSAGISIPGPYTIDITCPVKMDQVSLAGGLTLSDSGVINLYNGPGHDIDILADGFIRPQTAKNYSATFAFNAGAQINVSTGGKIIIGNGGSVPGYSALGYTPANVIWNDGSILEWNSPDPFVTAGTITYFPDAPANVIPVFRITRAPSLQPGSNDNTVWNGLLDVKANVTFKLGGLKTFRNGIIGTDSLFQDENCQQFIINGATAVLGGAGNAAAIFLNGAGLAINSPSLTKMVSDKVISSPLGGGTVAVNGSLYCDAYIMSGTAVFALAPGGTLGLGSGGGISNTGLTGNIQVSGSRTYDLAGNYIYNGAVNQVTGPGLPATVNTLTIANTGAPGNNTVTNSRSGTTTVNGVSAGSFALKSGLFSVGTGNNLSIADNGGIAAVTGNFSTSSSGSVTFLGTGLVSGTVNFYPNVYQSPAGAIDKAVNYGSSSTIHALLQLNAHAFIDVNAPVYFSGSLLKYNTGSTYKRSVEWSSATGKGFPYNVQMSNNTVFSPAFYLGYDNTPLKTAGNVTIDNGSAIYLDEGGNSMKLPLTVGGNLSINGSLSGSQEIGGDIEVAGNWTRSASGNFYPNNRAVFFNGSVPSTITANNGETFHYLYLSKNSLSDNLILNDNISVRNEFGINTGILTLGNKNLTFLSGATYTSNFGKMGSSGSINYSGTGLFVVNRYIPSGVAHAKSWQFLAVPVNNGGLPGGQTVNAAWQEGAASPNADPVPGYGTQITSSISPLPAMFDLLTPNGPTLKTYNPVTNGWDGIANTTTLSIYNPKGYMVFVRGDRSKTTASATANETILRTRGKIFEPNTNPPPTINIGANQFESIGNPYVSAIDFSNDLAVIKSANVQKVFYVWDPKLGGLYTYGAFQTFVKGAGSDYTVSPGGGSYGTAGSVNNIIQSGQAFFVHTVGGSGTVSFTENAKTLQSSVTFKPSHESGVADRQLRNNLYVLNNGNPVLVDGVLSQLDAGYSNNTDVLDALKLTGAGEYVSIRRDNKSLAVERMAMPVAADTIFYALGQMKLQQYQFEFIPDNLSLPGLTATLEDSYLGSATIVSLTDTTRISFNIGNEPGSYATNRFRVVFIKKYVPVKYTGIQAEVLNRDIMVSWKVSDQADISKYEVERSADAVNFTSVHAEPSQLQGGGSYGWLDQDPFPGTNYYRIRSVTTINQVAYSKRAQAFLGEAEAGFVIYPNPVKSNIIGLQFYGLPAGNYALRLYNNTGQLVLKQSVVHPGGSILQPVDTGKKPAKGIYRLQLTAPGGDRHVKKLLVD